VFALFISRTETQTSNMSNSENPLSLIKYASSLGYITLLDAAALAGSAMEILDSLLATHPPIGTTTAGMRSG
jgi:hypothetical protein